MQFIRRLIRPLIWYYIILNAFLSPIGIFFLFFYTSKIDSPVLQNISDPKNQISISLIGYGNFIDNFELLRNPSLVLYLHDIRKPPKNKFRPISRFIFDNEPGKIIAIGKKFDIGDTRSRKIVHWVSTDHVVLYLCKGYVTHFTNKLSIELDQGERRTVSVTIENKRCDA